MSKHSERIWRSIAVAAAFVYLVAMFAPWHAGCYQSKSWPEALAGTFTQACGSWGSVLGIASVVLCYLIVVFALLGPRRSALSLEPLRVVLSLSLVALTVLDILTHLPGSHGSPLVHSYKSIGNLGYGAWVALGASLALLLAFSVLDAGGLDRLLNRLPAWARIDRLELSDEEDKQTSDKTALPQAMRSYRFWTAVLILALVAYLLSLLTNWWSYSYGETNGSTLNLLNLFSGRTTHLDGFEGIGEICALLALAICVVAGLAQRDQEHRLERLRNTLVASLLSLTFLNVVIVWRQKYDLSFSSRRLAAHSRPDYGVLITLASILLMLFATLAVNAGGWRKLISRLPGWVRLDRLDEPPERNEETA